MHILIQWLVNALAVYATAHILSGIHIKSFGAAVLVALVLGLINAIVRPVLVFLSIPFIIVTLGYAVLRISFGNTSRKRGTVYFCLLEASCGISGFHKTAKIS